MVGRGRGGGREKEGVRDWVSSDCESGQLHMFLIKVLTLWDQLHTGMLVFVIRPNVLWSGGSLKTGPVKDHLLSSLSSNQGKKIMPLTSHDTAWLHAKKKKK